MEIKVLGPGCHNCQTLEKSVRNVLAELGVAAEVEKVTDIRKIMEFPILSTPGLVVDGRVVCSGRVPRPEEIKAWILQAAG
jgi:small redox-active disulfide protein 2